MPKTSTHNDPKEIAKDIHEYARNNNSFIIISILKPLCQMSPYVLLRHGTIVEF